MTQHPNSQYTIPKRVLVDFDGTLGPFSWPGVPEKPFDGCVEALTQLSQEGWEIWIFTTRVWPGWIDIDGAEFRQEKIQEMVDWLNRWNIPYHGITHEKMPAKFYIDDRAINPRYTMTPRTSTDWGEIARTVLASKDSEPNPRKGQP